MSLGRVGSRKSGGSAAGSGNVRFGTTNFDMDPRQTGPIVDKKFEGHSDLQQAAEKIKQAAPRH